MQGLELKNADLVDSISKNPNYNWIYERLVQDENDLVGAIAYVLYKQHKIEFINKIENETGNDPSKEQWAEFHRSTCLDSNIINYQKRAEGLVNQFLHSALASHAEHIESQAEQRMSEKVGLLAQNLTKEISKLKDTVDYNHSEIRTEISNKKSKRGRMAEAFLSIVYGVIVIALIGGTYNGYKWISNLNNKAESTSGIN